MRLASFSENGQQHLGIADGDELLRLPAHLGFPDSVLGLIEAGPSRWRALAEALPRLKREAEHVSPEAIEWLAPIPRPRKNIYCIGWNYAEHVSESADATSLSRGPRLVPVGESADATSRQPEPPKDPVVFTKNVTGVNGPYSDIPAQPQVTSQLDWEVELGVVIGTGGRSIAREQALEHVFGYTVINDVSARDVQFRHKQYFLGKSLDGACPMGPWIVTADEIPDPQNLALRSRVNGVLKQDSNTRHMIFDVATLISVLSRGMTLEPGDIIATGTPSGVGFARQPPEFLKPGDVVECEVEGIGLLRNRVV